MTKLINSFSNLHDADLDAVERQFGFTFPREYRELYLTANGGRLEKDRFVDKSGPYVIDAVLPIKYGTTPFLRFEQSLQWLKGDQHLLPDYLVPFAIAPFGNFFCFSIRDKDFGAVFFCDMDCPNPAFAVKFLAGSLGEFLTKLTVKPKRTPPQSSE